ncbi:MAG: bifunctional oligoribonuclease/PAP phosphatase NrnA [Candidatus Hydrogenedentes bacterium]|jgi:phosphoesterase RecJ-like protein|nr:bifunctional oligoribonuclease/PAP phosphatase NrnA [Candidatus Hydrogenedentota bacterium]
MTRIDLSAALATLKAADSFLLTTHADPDGDALGSMLGLRLFLQALGKTQIACVCHDPAPKSHAWLPGAELVCRPGELEGAPSADLSVITDVAQYERIGDAAAPVQSSREVLVLDHHLEEDPCGTLHFVDPSYASASEIIADLFDAADVPLSREAAECVYVGLTTDTGGFRFANTNSASHLRAAKMLATGIDVFEISSLCFDSMSVGKFLLLRRILDEMVIEESGLVAHTSLSRADIESVDAAPEDVNGLVNYARNIEGVRVGILFREVDSETVKISMRSHGEVNSAEVLKVFGGGGHAGAAGATVRMTLGGARGAVLAEVNKALRVGRATT